MTRQLGRAANGIEMNPIQNVGADVDAELPDLGIGPVGTASLPGPLTVAYITDVEGNYEYFKRCVDHSATLSFAPGSFAAGTTGAKAIDLTDEARLLLAKDSALVFGGDLFDKGPADIRLTRLLCDLKERHPSRVWLLMGNRDINKLRLSSEINTPGELDRLHDDPPFWDPSVPGLKTWLEERQLPHTKATRLQWILTCTMGAPNAFESRRQELAELRDLVLPPLLKRRSSVNEAKCSSNDTSAGNNSNNSRDEAHVVSARAAMVPDKDVVESFAQSVAPGGFVERYLRLATLGVQLGDTVFVHGALTDLSLGFVPCQESTRHALRFQPPPSEKSGDEAAAAAAAAPPGVRFDASSTSPVQWFHDLHVFAQRSLDDHAKHPIWLPDTQSSSQAAAATVAAAEASATTGSSKTHFDQFRRRGGEALLAYQSNECMRGHTVVVNAMCTHSSDPESLVPPLSLQVAAWLHCWQLRRVVVGHKPVGPAPLLAKFPSNGTGAPGSWPSDKDEDGSADTKEVLCCDTSFSDPQAPDSRGGAAFAVTLSFPSPGTRPSTPSSSEHKFAEEAQPPDPSRRPGSSGSGKDANGDNGSVTSSVASVRGCLATGEALFTPNVTADALVGRRSVGGWWVVGRRDLSPEAEPALSGRSYMLTRTKGRVVGVRWEKETDLKRELERRWAAGTSPNGATAAQ